MTRLEQERQNDEQKRKKALDERKKAFLKQREAVKVALSSVVSVF